MEEKRQGNEIILRGAKLKERDIERAAEQGRVVTNGSLEILLPKLKKKHEQSNADITLRQERIINILKGDKIQKKLHSPESRRFFGG